MSDAEWSMVSRFVSFVTMYVAVACVLGLLWVGACLAYDAYVDMSARARRRYYAWRARRRGSDARKVVRLDQVSAQRRAYLDAATRAGQTQRDLSRVWRDDIRH